MSYGMKVVCAFLVVLMVAFFIDPALAQWEGGMDGAEEFTNWATGELMVYVVIIALLCAVIVGLAKWSLEWALGAFLVICILAGVVGMIPGIAESLVNLGA